MRAVRVGRSREGRCLRLAADSYRGSGARAAQLLAHDRIGTEHLLLALAEDERGDAGRALGRLGISAGEVRADILTLVGACNYAHRRPIDGDALATLGIDLDEVRDRVEAAFGPGALDRTWSGSLSLTPRAKGALERACRESGWKVPGSGALLVGLAAVEDGVAAQVLRRRGITVQTLRDALR